MVSETDSPFVEVSSTDYGGLLDDQQFPRPDSFDRPAEAILRELGVDRGVSVFLTSELPPYTGVGAVSGSAVALAWALAELRHQPMTVTEAARLVSLVEAERLGLPFGVSDAYAQALGGLTFVEVTEGGVCASQIPVSEDLRVALEARLMLFFTGRVQRDRTPSMRRAEPPRRTGPG